MNQHLVTTLIDLAVVLFAFSKRNNPAAKALGFFALALSLWSFELYLLKIIKDLNVLDFWFHLTRWGMFFIPPCFALLAWRIMGSQPHSFFTKIIVPSFAASTLLSLGNLLLFPSELQQTEYGYSPKPDAIYALFTLTFLWSYLGSLAYSFKSYSDTGYRDRMRVKWLFITSGICFAFGLLSILLVPYSFYISNYFGSFINVAFIALVMYSTIEHNLMDFKLAISIGLARAVLLGISIWALFYFTSITNALDQADGGMLALALFLIVTLEVYPRALNWVLARTRKILGTTYVLDEIKVQMRDALNACFDQASFRSVLDYYLIQVVGVKHCRVNIVASETGGAKFGVGQSPGPIQLGVCDPVDPLFQFCEKHDGLVMADETPADIHELFERLDAFLGFCIYSRGNPIGLAIVSAPKRAEFYSYDDVQLFEWLQVEMAQVLKRIQRIDEMQEQLGQAKKTLSMLGVMNHYHHDIKAPLAIIDGVLSNDMYDKEKQKEIVLQQVERGSRLIATMAGILKGERKRRILPVDLGEVVKDSLFLFAQGISKLEKRLDDVPQIYGDAEDLKILIINIVKNAIEATRNDLILDVSLSFVNDTVILSISDNGRGMDQEQVNCLWSDNISDKRLGSGIGLQAIKRIADEHDASIEVESTVGRGTCFTFHFEDIVQIDPNEVDTLTTYTTVSPRPRGGESKTAS